MNRRGTRLVLTLIAAFPPLLSGGHRAHAGTVPCPPVPQVIDSVERNPSDPTRLYELADLDEGDFYFTDRNTPGSHILVDVPPLFECAQWVKTPNDDKHETTDPADNNGIGLLSIFGAETTSLAVYVGLDNRAVRGPNWLVEGRFGDMGRSIGITETGSQTAFDVWAATFQDDWFIELGGNSAAGSDFSLGKSNYVVFAKPDTDFDLIPDELDNCPAPPEFGSASIENTKRATANSAQIDADGDGEGDVCDPDIDGDGVPNEADNCPYDPNPGQLPSSPGSRIGAACWTDVTEGFETDRLDPTQRYHFAVDLDRMPRRGEMRIEIVPEAMNRDVEVGVECGGPDFTADYCDDDFGPFLDRRDCARFPTPVAFKVDHRNEVVTPFAMTPFDRQRDESTDVTFRAMDGEWVVPFFVFFLPAAIGPDATLDVTCHIELRRAAFSDSTEPYKAIFRPRTKPARTKYGEDAVYDEDFNADNSEFGEYGFFTPAGENFTLLFDGEDELGQCQIDEFDVGSYTPVPDARGWNCCTFEYTTSAEDEHLAGLPSQLGHAAIWTGTLPEDEKPDVDGDTILDTCDNCLTTPNTVQENDDGDAFGNRCDNCDFVDNPGQEDADLDDIGDACDNCAQVDNIFQDNGDGLGAGDDCQCSDVDDSGGRDILDAVMARRFDAGAATPASFDPARCVLDAGPTPCDDVGARALRGALARGAALVESCL